MLPTGEGYEPAATAAAWYWIGLIAVADLKWWCSAEGLMCTRLASASICSGSAKILDPGDRPRNSAQAAVSDCHLRQAAELLALQQPIIDLPQADGPTFGLRRARHRTGSRGVGWVLPYLDQAFGEALDHVVAAACPDPPSRCLRGHARSV